MTEYTCAYPREIGKTQVFSLTSNYPKHASAGVKQSVCVCVCVCVFVCLCVCVCVCVCEMFFCKLGI